MKKAEALQANPHIERSILVFSLLHLIERFLYSSMTQKRGHSNMV